MSALAIASAVVAVALVVAVGLAMSMVAKRRRRAARMVAYDVRRAERIGRLVAAQRGPAETAAERLRVDLHQH